MKKKILLLDDSTFMLTTTGDMIKSFGYEVATAKCGLVACQKVDSTRFDMIITDMNMPGMDGLSFTKKIKNHPNCKFVPIVMLSSETSDERISEAKKLGVSTFLSKPVKEIQLKSLLQITLSNRRAPRIPIKLEIFYGEEEMQADYKESHTFNVSAGGMFVETSNPLPPGEKIKLKMSLPNDAQPIHCQAQVAWINTTASPINKSHPTGMGVEFLDLKDELRLRKFLQSRPSSS